MKHLHVTGCRRSGTTLLFEMLSSCFRHDERCDHEQSVFVDTGQDLNEDAVYFSKKPSDIAFMHRIFQQNPDLFVIYLLRDPRAVVTSIHPTRSDIYYASFERWRRYQRAAASLQGHPRFLQVRYEDLVGSPQLVQAEIEEKFPFLQTRFRFEDFHLHAQTSKKAEISLRGLRPISTSSLQNWQQHLPRIQYQVLKYPDLRIAVRQYGYETDDSWLQLLDGVKAKSQSYGEITPNVIKRLETRLRYFIKTQVYLKRRRLRSN